MVAPRHETGSANHSDDSTSPQEPRRYRRRIALALAAILGLSLWSIHAPLFTALARAYIVDEPLPPQADVIVVLGGGNFFRPTAAAALYHRGVARRILVAHPAITDLVALGVVPPEGEIATQFLATLGVPPSAIEPLQPVVRSTHDEAVALREWARSHSARCLVIPTDIFHTRRVKWTAHRELRTVGTEVRVTAIDPIRYAPDNWWRSEEGTRTFASELGKLVYYRLRY